jgi:hypothetical protein
MQVQGCCFELLFFLFINTSKDQTMVDNAITSSSFPVVLVQDEKLEEEFEEASIDMNVSQRPCEEKSIRRVVRI